MQCFDSVLRLRARFDCIRSILRLPSHQTAMKDRRNTNNCKCIEREKNRTRKSMYTKQNRYIFCAKVKKKAAAAATRLRSCDRKWFCFSLHCAVVVVVFRTGHFFCCLVSFFSLLSFFAVVFVLARALFILHKVFCADSFFFVFSHSWCVYASAPNKFIHLVPLYILYNRKSWHRHINADRLCAVAIDCLASSVSYASSNNDDEKKNDSRSSYESRWISHRFFLSFSLPPCVCVCLCASMLWVCHIRDTFFLVGFCSLSVLVRLSGFEVDQIYFSLMFIAVRRIDSV